MIHLSGCLLVQLPDYGVAGIDMMYTLLHHFQSTLCKDVITVRYYIHVSKVIKNSVYTWKNGFQWFPVAARKTFRTGMLHLASQSSHPHARNEFIIWNHKWRSESSHYCCWDGCDIGWTVNVLVLLNGSSYPRFLRYTHWAVGCYLGTVTKRSTTGINIISWEAMSDEPIRCYHIRRAPSGVCARVELGVHTAHSRK